MMVSHLSTDSEGNVVLRPETLQEIVSSAVQAATQAVLAAAQSSRPSDTKKVRRPRVSKGLSLEHWNFFVSKWTQYKIMADIS